MPDPRPEKARRRTAYDALQASGQPPVAAVPSGMVLVSKVALVELEALPGTKASHDDKDAAIWNLSKSAM